MHFNRRGIFWTIIFWICLVLSLTCLGFFFPVYEIQHTIESEYIGTDDRYNATWDDHIAYLTPENRYLTITV